MRISFKYPGELIRISLSTRHVSVHLFQPSVYSFREVGRNHYTDQPYSVGFGRLGMIMCANGCSECLVDAAELYAKYRPSAPFVDAFLARVEEYRKTRSIKWE